MYEILPAGDPGESAEGRAVEKNKCWGREGELSSLLDSVTDSRRSVTLVYGDSGIGKSTVLEEFAARLRSYPRTFVGYYESSAADVDPLFHTLDDLLAQVYAAGADMRNACLSLRHDTCMAQAKPLLLNVPRGTLTAGGLSLLATTAIDAFEWLVDDDVPKRDRATTSRLPALNIEAFRAVAKMLHKAQPKGDSSSS